MLDLGDIKLSEDARLGQVNGIPWANKTAASTGEDERPCFVDLPQSPSCTGSPWRLTGSHGPRYISHTYPHSSYHGETSRTITLLRIDRGPSKRHRETAPVFRHLSSLRLIAIPFAPLVLSYKLSHFSKSVEVCRQRELPPSSAVRALAAKSLFIAGSYPLW